LCTLSARRRSLLALVIIIIVVVSIRVLDVLFVHILFELHLIYVGTPRRAAKRAAKGGRPKPSGPRAHGLVSLRGAEGLTFIG
jgi:hypothetical protein